MSVLPGEYLEGWGGGNDAAQRRETPMRGLPPPPRRRPTGHLRAAWAYAVGGGGEGSHGENQLEREKG